MVLMQLVFGASCILLIIVSNVPVRWAFGRHSAHQGGLDINARVTSVSSKLPAS